MDVNEKILEEITEIQNVYIASMLRIADKHGLNRDFFLERSTGALALMVALGSFSEYEFREDSDCKSM